MQPFKSQMHLLSSEPVVSRIGLNEAAFGPTYARPAAARPSVRPATAPGSAARATGPRRGRVRRA